MKPGCPKCSAPLEETRILDDVAILDCPSCFGAFYKANQLAVPLTLSSPEASRWACPACGGVMNTGAVFDGRFTLEQCPACRGFWFDAGEIQKLRKLSGTENVVGHPAKAPEETSVLPTAGMAVFAAQMASRLPAERTTTSRGGDDDATRADPDAGGDREARAPDSSGIVEPGFQSESGVKHDGRLYQHFQTSIPVVSHVLGEFNWKVKVGDVSRARDFISPPYLLSEEISGKESVWSRGEYLEPDEVWRGFGLPGAPPPRRGVAPNQPNPWADTLKGMRFPFWAALAACLAVQVALSVRSQSRQAFAQVFSYSVSDAEKSKVTDIFELGGHASNVELKTETSLNNQWAYLNFALINADTDEAVDFGRGLSYYQGMADGERWSEGSSNDTVYLSSVKPGRYYLRIEPETDSTTPAFNYRIQVTRDVPRHVFFSWAVFLLALPLGWAWWRNKAFEQARWLDSDHPLSSGGDDDQYDENKLSGKQLVLYAIMALVTIYLCIKFDL